MRSNQTITDIQRRSRDAGATLHGIIEPSGPVLEAKFMLPWAFDEAAAEKHMPRLQHSMWVCYGRVGGAPATSGNVDAGTLRPLAGPNPGPPSDGWPEPRIPTLCLEPHSSSDVVLPDAARTG